MNQAELLQGFLSLATVLLAAQLGGWVFRRLGQPSVVGEITGGIFLGPSVLGFFAPEVMELLIPASSRPVLTMAAQLGVLLYMFFIGIEFDLSSFRKRSRATLTIAGASLALPFLMGLALGYPLYESLAGAGAPFSAFLLFFGVAMTVTAFPVMARILMERGEFHSKIGALALSCAALKDLTAWCLLALVTGVVHAKASGPLFTWLFSAAYLLVMLLALRPWMELWLGKRENRIEKSLGKGGYALLLGGLVLSATATELIGIHAIFGAFLFGAIVPHVNRIDSPLFSKLEAFARIFLLPAFFAVTGMRTQIWLVDSARDLWIAGMILFVAISGKFLGGGLAARFTGHSWKESATLGVLLNTRGLVELIVLNVGLDLALISPKLFSILVFMALFTTYMTGPLLNLVWKRRETSLTTSIEHPTSAPAGS